MNCQVKRINHDEQHGCKPGLSPTTAPGVGLKPDLHHFAKPIDWRRLPRLALLLIATGILHSAQAEPATSPTAQATPTSLGRLFFTPETRAALDRQRSATQQQHTQDLQGANLTLNGTIVRSNGKRTYWINGRAQQGDALPPGLSAHTPRNTPAQTTFNITGEPPTTLRVGESATRGTEEPAAALPDNLVVRKSR